MQLVIISGRSGSGKSTALHVLEDAGFTCIDNLPASLLPNLAKYHSQVNNQRYAVSIDARNPADELQQLPSIIQDEAIKAINHHIIFLDANDDALLQRFSETRRKHPLSNKETDLRQAIQEERERLRPIVEIADTVLDTSDMKYHDLRSIIKQRFMAIDQNQMAVMFQSFGFKYGIPKDADLVYDVRCLPNPHWQSNLRLLTGRDAPVQEFLGQQVAVTEMIDDIKDFLTRWLPRYEENNRSYITIAIGCTGGQHRSVYICERLEEHFSNTLETTQKRHRELSTHD